MVKRRYSFYLALAAFGLLLLGLLVSTFQWSNQTQTKILHDIYALSQDEALLIQQVPNDLTSLSYLALVNQDGVQWTHQLPATPKQAGRFITAWDNQILIQTSQPGGIVALDKASGHDLWQNTYPNLTEMTDSDFYYPLKHTNTSLNFFFNLSQAQGELVANEATDGRQQWQIAIPDSLHYAWRTKNFIVLRYDEQLQLFQVKNGKLSHKIQLDSEPCITADRIYYTHQQKLFQHDLATLQTTKLDFAQPLALTGQCSSFQDELILAANTENPLRPLLLGISNAGKIGWNTSLSQESAQFIVTPDYSASLPPALPTYLPLIVEVYQEEQRQNSVLYLEMFDLKAKKVSWKLRLPSQAKDKLGVVGEWLNPFHFVAAHPHYYLKYNGYLMSLNGQTGQLEKAVTISDWDNSLLMPYHITKEALWGFLDDQWFKLAPQSLGLQSKGQGKHGVEVLDKTPHLKKLMVP